MQQANTTSSGPRALNPSPTPPKKPAAPISPRTMILLGAGAFALVVLGVALFYFTRPMEEPPLNADTDVILKFAASDAFNKLSFDRQTLFMKTIEDREKEIKKAYEAGKYTDSELRLAKELAWFGDQIDQMNKYHAKANQRERLAYLDKVLDVGEPPKEEKPKSREPTPSGRDSSDVKRDETTEDARPITWPADVQARWKEYRAALRERRHQIEAAQNPASKPATGG